MRPLTDEEKRSGKRGVGGTYGGQEALHDDSTIVTVVPTAEKDFRGVFGDVERAVNAFRDMMGHDHRDPAQSLPLFRLMTWFDPQFVTAWVTGATVIARDRSPKGTTQAIAFLNEAEPHNPYSVAIPTEIGRLMLSRNQDLEGALPFLETAMGRGLREPAKLSEIEKDGLQLASRLLALVYRDLGKWDRMQKHLEAAVKVFQDDKMLRRLLERTDGPAANPSPSEEPEGHEGHGH